jgi:outer membrane protein assembly factor BamD (BamD/ComL family)
VANQAVKLVDHLKRNSMEKEPTAKEFYLNKAFPISFENRRDEVELWFETSPDAKQSVEIMIEFAKMHVKAALKQAAHESQCYNKTKFPGDENWVVDIESILNSYPLENIK